MTVYPHVAKSLKGDEKYKINLQFNRNTVLECRYLKEIKITNPLYYNQTKYNKAVNTIENENIGKTKLLIEILLPYTDFNGIGFPFTIATITEVLKYIDARTDLPLPLKKCIGMTNADEVNEIIQQMDDETIINEMVKCLQNTFNDKICQLKREQLTRFYGIYTDEYNKERLYHDYHIFTYDNHGNFYYLI